MQCPVCNGRGGIDTIACLNPGGVRQHWRNCEQCKGTGKITQDLLNAIEFGRAYRADRIASLETVSKRAKKLGVLPSVLSRVECGLIEDASSKSLYDRLVQELMNEP